MAQGAEPNDIERLGVIFVMPMDMARRAASLARFRLLQLPVPDGIVDGVVRPISIGISRPPFRYHATPQLPSLRLFFYSTAIVFPDAFDAASPLVQDYRIVYTRNAFASHRDFQSERYLVV